MKLWEKNYLVAFLLFLVILNGSLFLLTASAFHRDLRQSRNSAVSEEKSLCYTIQNLYEPQDEAGKLIPLSRQYRESGIGMRIEQADRVVLDTLPQGCDVGDAAGSLRIVCAGGAKQIQITDEVKTGSTTLRLIYLRDISQIYRIQRGRLAVTAAGGLILSILAGGVLHAAMKNIYRPVENIAHELRTPLTCIRGYAQYLTTAGLSQEDRFFATEQILAESQNLKDIVEKLLIIGNLRNGSVEMRPVRMEPLFDLIRERYPRVEIQSSLDTVMGDETLLRSLLDNLVGNAVRAGKRAAVTARGHSIRVWNDGPPIKPDLLKCLNRNISPSREQIAGNDFGVRLCHEIAKLHRGSLSYASDEEAGTLVTFDLPPGSVAERKRGIDDIVSDLYI